jgi:hypothetical protein
MYVIIPDSLDSLITLTVWDGDRFVFPLLTLSEYAYDHAQAETIGMGIIARGGTAQVATLEDIYASGLYSA